VIEYLSDSKGRQDHSSELHDGYLIYKMLDV
jgi:hypothetical protein